MLKYAKEDFKNWRCKLYRISRATHNFLPNYTFLKKTTFHAPFEEGRAYYFAAVCISVGRSIHHCFRSFFFAYVSRLEMKLVYSFFIIISKSGSILGTIVLFSTELCPLKIPIICSLRSFSSWMLPREVGISLSQTSLVYKYF